MWMEKELVIFSVISECRLEPTLYSLHYFKVCANLEAWIGAACDLLLLLLPSEIGNQCLHLKSPVCAQLYWRESEWVCWLFPLQTVYPHLCYNFLSWWLYYVNVTEFMISERNQRLGASLHCQSCVTLLIFFVCYPSYRGASTVLCCIGIGTEGKIIDLACEYSLSSQPVL